MESEPKDRDMNRKILSYGLIPFLFGFLLLGAVKHPSAHRDRGAHAAAPARPAPAPQLRGALERQDDAATIAPLPVYVTAPDDTACTGIRVCNWST
jgi:hypothetical protein